MYLGDYRLADTLYFSFTTRRFTTGAPFALASGAISVYKDADDTQTTTGVTLAADDDGITGWNRVTIDLSDAFYTTATDFQVVITTGTVDSVSVVGEVVAHFSIENRSAVMPTTAGRKLDVSAGGEAGIDWANVGSPTTALNLSGTNIDVDQIVASVSGAVGSVAAGGIAAASFAAGAIDASAIAANAIGASEIADGAIDAGTFAANSITAAATAADFLAEVNAEVVDALNVDTYAEPGQGTPAATTTLVAKIGYLYKAWRNKHTQTATEYALMADDGTTKDQEAGVSDDGVTFTRNEMQTGA